MRIPQDTTPADHRAGVGLSVNSLFSGGGTFDHGAHLAGWTTASLCEYDPQATAVLNHRWPDVPVHPDIRTLDGATLPDAELIMGGSPCQSLSVAGKRSGIRIESLEEYLRHKDDPELQDDLSASSLFWEMVRVIKEKRDATSGQYPALALWENVPGAFSSHGGRDFAIVVRAFLDIGARDAAWRVLDSQHFGVPQRRRRIFLVADFGGERAHEILFEREGLRGHPAPGAGQGQDVAGRPRTSPDRRHPGEGIAQTLSAPANGPRYDAETETFIPVSVSASPVAYGIYKDVTPKWGADIMPTLRAPTTGGTQTAVAHPVLATTTGLASALTTQQNGQGTGLGSPRGDGSDNQVVAAPPLPTLSIRERGREGGRNLEYITEQAYALTAPTGGGRADDRNIAHPVAFHATQDPISSTSTFPCLTAGSTEGQATLGVGNAEGTVAGVERNGALTGDVTHTLQAKSTGGMSVNVTPNVITPYAVRRLTPVECERLQFLPDGWTAVPWKGGILPDSARYRILGNGGTASVIAWILNRMARVLKGVPA